MSPKKHPNTKEPKAEASENQAPILSDQHLLKLAKELEDRWEDVFRQGLVIKEGDRKSVGPACLPFDQLEICRKLCPKDPILQAYHALARWRWFCWYVGCPNNLALNALTKAVSTVGIKDLGSRLQDVNAAYSSLEYV